MTVPQMRAADFIVDNPHAGIFLDMGLGKTGATLTALAELIPQGFHPILIVGPIRVIETVWPVEAKLWAHTKHLKFSVIRGNEEQRIAAVAKQADIYLINPEMLRWFIQKYKKYLKAWKVLIVDESSDFKDPGSKRFKSLRFQVKKFQRRYILTGTPRPNSLLELYTQILILDLGRRFGTRFDFFKDRFFEPVDYFGYKWEPKAGAKKRIYEMLADLVIRIQSKGKKPIENRVEIRLPPKAMKVYREMEDEALSYIDKHTELSAKNVVAAMMKCRQIANGAVYDEDKNIHIIHLEKVKACEKIVNETGSPVIIVYNFKHERDLLAKKLKAYNPVILSQAKHPNKVIAKWNEGKIPVLLLHPKSGGHGLNLQHGGHTQIWLGLTFSYEQYAQTIKRIDRMGQKFRPVIHTLIAPGTVDELIEQAIKSKARGQRQLLRFLRRYSDARDIRRTRTDGRIPTLRRKREHSKTYTGHRSGGAGWRRKVYASRRAGQTTRR